ncbi:MAG: TonB-dependent receptor [Anaerolineae bacterium]|nr:TonB-dependent receptor [Anaerolineae bacterium]
MLKPHNLVSVCVIILLIGAIGTSPALAAGPTVLEEIIVTAKKREQNLQDIAGSIQAIGSEELSKSIVNGFDDYARMVPSLSVMNSGGGQTQIALRGVLAARFNHAQPQSRSTMGMYLGDIPISTSAFNPDVGLVDIERIEILRGPQGTLYGASAMSGAIRIIPKAPNMDEFEGEINLSAGFTDGGDNSYIVKGVVNIPVSDSFAVRASGYYIEKGGYIDNVFSGEENYNDEESFGGRLSALWNVTDSVSLDALVMFHELQADGRPDEYVPGNPLNSVGLNSGGSLIASPFESQAQWTVDNEREIIKTINDPFDDEYYILGLTANVDLDWGLFTSVTSYYDRDFENTLDDQQRTRDALGAYQAGFYVPGAGENAPLSSVFINSSKMEQFAQELRISSSGDNSFQWLAGLFYMDQNRTFDQTQEMPGLDTLLNFFGIGAEQGFVWGSLPDNVFTGAQTIDTEQWALFGEATLAFGSRQQFEFTAGLRWFNYDQKADIFFSGIANDGVTQLNEKTSESGVSPNFVLKYIASDDVNVYASAAKGFRIGGLNDPIPLAGVFGSACASDLESLGLTSLQNSFESDELWNYELGMKSTLNEGKVRLNTALFYIDWKDVQTQAFLPCGFQTLTNDADLISKGVEVELLAQASESLSLNLGISYTDAELNGDSQILAAEDGARAPYVPKWLIYAGFDFTRPLNILGGDKLYYIRADLQYTSNSYSEFSNTFVLPRVELPSHTSGNIYIGLIDSKWEAALFIKNVSDERIVTGFDADRRQPSTFSIARPRTVGFDVKFRF